MELLLQADRETDEVFAQFTLVPLPQVNFAVHNSAFSFFLFFMSRHSPLIV